MNSTVISGTPRTNSMNMIDTAHHGNAERRPNANRMPSGNENTMPMVATTMVTRMPPHRLVGTRQTDQRQAAEQDQRQDRQHDEEIDGADIAARRRKPQQPDQRRMPARERTNRPASAGRPDRSHRRNRRTNANERPAGAGMRTGRRRKAGLAIGAGPGRVDQEKANSGGTIQAMKRMQITSARYWPATKTDWLAASRAYRAQRRRRQRSAGACRK